MALFKSLLKHFVPSFLPDLFRSLVNLHHIADEGTRPLFLSQICQGLGCATGLAVHKKVQDYRVVVPTD